MNFSKKLSDSDCDSGRKEHEARSGSGRGSGRSSLSLFYCLLSSLSQPLPLSLLFVRGI